MIKIEGVTKIFKSKDGDVVALEDINLVLPNKGMVFIIGRSGSGKSTLLNLIAGFDSVTKGKIIANGRDVTSFNEGEDAEYHFEDIGFVFQNYSLLENKTVKDNIAIGSKKRARALEEEIKQSLKDVGLEGYENKVAKKLSGGEKQRVSIARAIIKKPKIILCDEPCGNLDGASSKLVLETLKKASETALVVLVSHNLNDAYFYGDRIISLLHGKVQEDLVYDSRVYANTTYACISDLNSLTKKQLKTLNRELRAKNCDGIYRRKDCFVPYKAKQEEEVIETPPKTKSKFLPSVYSLIRRGSLKTGLFAVLIALIISLFSLCYSFSSFDADSLLYRSYDFSQANSVQYSKRFDSSTGLSSSNINPFEDGEEEIFKKVGYKGNFYPLKKFVVSTTASSVEALARDKTVTLANFKRFYASEMGGLLLADEDFIKQNLDLDELEITYASTLHDDGIYITDYFADSLVYRNAASYRNREDVLGYHSIANKMSENKVYIDGIITTNYEKRFKKYIDGFSDGTLEYSVLLEKENLADYEYLKNCLNIGYSTNENFFDDYSQDNWVYKTSWNIKADGEYLSTSKTYTSLTYSSNIPEGYLLVKLEALRNTFTASTAEEIEKTLNNFSNFYLVGLGYPGDTSSINPATLSFPIKKVLIAENHPEYVSSSTTPYYSSLSLFVGTSDYESIRKQNQYTFSYYFDNVDSAVAIKDKIPDESNISLITEYSDAIFDVDILISSFGSTFMILCLLAVVASILIIIFYGISMVRQNTYNIGVLKALGYKGQELTNYYLLNLFVFALIVSMFFLAFYLILIRIVNAVLVDSLMSLNSKAAYLKTVGLFDFNYGIYFGVIFCFLLALSLICLLYLFVLRKFKAIRMLQNKE